jgi:hypothetical protein
MQLPMTAVYWKSHVKSISFPGTLLLKKPLFVSAKASTSNTYNVGGLMLHVQTNFQHHVSCIAISKCDYAAITLLQDQICLPEQSSWQL